MLFYKGCKKKTIKDRNILFPDSGVEMDKLSERYHFVCAKNPQKYLAQGGAYGNCPESTTYAPTMQIITLII